MSYYDLFPEMTPEITLQYPHRFAIPIGDWSGDGHQLCKRYTIRCNKSLADIRNAHCRIQDATGIDIENLCDEYGEDEIPAETVNLFDALGLSYINEDEDVGMEPGESFCPSPENLRDMWLDLLQIADSSLKFIPEEDPEDLPFCGFDDQGRHISAPGYGLFNADQI